MHRILCKTHVFINVDFNQKSYLFPCTPLERAKSAEEVIMTTEKTEKQAKMRNFDMAGDSPQMTTKHQVSTTIYEE